MKPTLLFVNGHPVAYTIKQAGDRFCLCPCHNSHPDVVPPSLVAYRDKDQWIIEGCSDRNLYDQVVEDLESLTPANS